MSENQQERDAIVQRQREREARELAEAAAAQGTTATEEIPAPRTSNTGAIAKTGPTTARTDAPRIPYDVNDPAYHRIDPDDICLLYTSPSPRDGLLSRMPSSA